MKLEQNIAQVQRLALTQAMRQSLECLQMSALALNEYVQELALSNPLLDVQPATYYEVELPSEVSAADKGETSGMAEDRDGSERAERAGGLSDCFAKEKTFREYLCEQIGQTKLVDDEMLPICRYLINCLDDRGYLDCPLDELSAETGWPVFRLEQALYAVQMLDPPGVGARNLSECLVLQLVQGRDFNLVTLAVAREGLALLGEHRYGELAARLGVSVREARRAGETVLALNPIPASGFSSGRQTVYAVPDAFFYVEHGEVEIELNEALLPRVSINGEYLQMLKGQLEPETARYLKEKLSEAQMLVRGIHTRCDTFLCLICRLAEAEKDFFCHGGALRPLTMQQLAEEMQVSVSTVSRAAQNKYIAFQGRTIPVRSLFTAALRTDEELSAHSVKQRLRVLLREEDASAPLSDEALCCALAASGIQVSRRAVAKYRLSMGIPSSSQRRRIGPGGERT